MVSRASCHARICKAAGQEMEAVSIDRAQQISLYVGFMRYCNGLAANATERSIIGAICSDLQALPDRSLSDIAEQAHVSEPSVSRLIRKIGFLSTQEFKRILREEGQHYAYRRTLLHERNYHSQDAEEITAALYDAMQENLASTKEHLQTQTVLEMLSAMRNSHRVFLLGDTHETQCFHRLQISLFSLGVPALMVNQPEWDGLLSGGISARDSVFFVSVAAEWYAPWQQRFVREAATHGAKLLLLSQDDLGLREATHAMRYGLPGSFNNGYYSLPYLNEVFCELLFQDSHSSQRAAKA